MVLQQAAFHMTLNLLWKLQYCAACIPENE